MLFRAAVVLFALTVPAVAQHGGVRAGSIGHGGFSRSAGFSSRSGFSAPGAFARPAQPIRYAPLAGAGFRAPGIRSPYNQTRFATVSRPYNPAATLVSRGSNRDRFDARRRQFQNWYVYTYPNWAGYPYLINPNLYNLGLYDWSEPDDTAYANPQPSLDQPDQNPYPPPYPDSGYAYAAPPPQPAASAPLASEQPLTVVFKTGRTPIKVQNYMMTATVFTDLDPQHYEQIPLDQINLAATQLFNSAAGVDFQIPTTSRN